MNLRDLPIGTHRRHPSSAPIFGSISHGTMRPQDLIPRFLKVAESLGARFAIHKKTLHCALIAGENHSYWTSEESDLDLISLFNALDDVAPAGHYFGAHPGDGSDYGFWPVEDDDSDDSTEG